MHGASPKLPSSDVYSPPGIGLRRVSKVVADVMRAAERALISADASGRNETPRTWEEMGSEGFMVSSGLPSATVCALCQVQMCNFTIFLISFDVSKSLYR